MPVVMQIDSGMFGSGVPSVSTGGDQLKDVVGALTQHWQLESLQDPVSGMS